MIPPRSNIKPPLKSQFKPLHDITLDELAYIASPVFAQNKFHDKPQRIDGIPATLQPQQIENAEWVLLCQDGSKHSPAFAYNKPLQRWDVHTRITGVTRTALQSHLNTLQPRWMKPSTTGSSASVATEYASVPTPPPAFDATSAATRTHRTKMHPGGRTYQHDPWRRITEPGRCGTHRPGAFYMETHLPHLQ